VSFEEAAGTTAKLNLSIRYPVEHNLTRMYLSSVLEEIINLFPNGSHLISSCHHRNKRNKNDPKGQVNAIPNPIGMRNHAPKRLMQKLLHRRKETTNETCAWTRRPVSTFEKNECRNVDY
jgi:hypothetical protein